MARRGPDAEGIWSDEAVSLGHRRLAILDLDPRSNQPMASSDGRYQMVFNGEIYNFADLRRELAGQGCGFRTTSDTEVLLVLFDRERERMLPRLRGMFALAIWDSQSRELFLARDPYGIKPLYYAQTSQGFVFASQVKALQASRLVSQAIEPAAVAGFYLWGSVPEPWTLNRGVFALPAGHWLRIGSTGSPAPVRWVDVTDAWGETAPRDLDLAAHVRAAVTESVRAHLVSDVPVCVFLSAGIDSAVVAGLAAELGAAIEAVTVGFDEFAGTPEDEVPAAAAIAAHYGLRHVIRRVSAAEFEADLPRVLDAMDQPSIDGINTWFASKAAAERGFKVALSGIGGDEMFCGYSTFRRIPTAARIARTVSRLPGASSVVGMACDYLARNPARAKLAALPDMMGSFEGLYFLSRALFIPRELSELMGADAARDGLERLGVPSSRSALLAAEAVSAVARLESTHYLRNQLLRDSDWSSMAHSLELRTPLVDHPLLQSLAPWTKRYVAGAGKQMLAGSPALPLPVTVARRPKTGFALPMAQWLARSEVAGVHGQDPSGPWSRPWAKAVARAAGCA
jgi:asparagine synthase (glutamine-hydrolysing)